MKLRLRGQSLHLRLIRSEGAALANFGRIEESVQIGPEAAARLVCRLQFSAIQQPKPAGYQAGGISVFLPEEAGRRWISGATVGLYGDPPWGLRLLIEKDFKCLGEFPQASDYHAFEHPIEALRAGCGPAARPTTARRAFTLIELLVVMAITGILAGLIFPALARAKEKSRSAWCAGNLRQWGLAYRMYADDNHDCLPRRGQGIQTLVQINRPEDWFNNLPEYFGLAAFQDMVKNNARPVAHAHSVFICPAAEDPGGIYFLPYGMNMNLSPWNLPSATKFGEVVQPACVVAMADAPGPYASTFPSVQPYSLVARHAARVNLLFLGGSVQSLAGADAGCGKGDPGRPDVRWLTGTASDATAHNY